MWAPFCDIITINTREDKQKSPAWQAKANEPSLVRYIGYDKCKYSVGEKCKYYKNGICDNENNCEEGGGFEGREGDAPRINNNTEWHRGTEQGGCCNTEVKRV